MVDRRRQQDVHEPQEGVDVGGCGDVTAVRQEGDAARQVEAHHDHQVSVAQRSLLAAAAPKTTLHHLDVREKDERDVHAHEADDRSQAHQADRHHVVAVTVRDGAAETRRARQTHQRRHNVAAAQQPRQQGEVDDFCVACRWPCNGPAPSPAAASTPVRTGSE